MRLGIVSDIHCNAAGLEVALGLMGPVDELVCVGDSIYQYRFSNEVVEMLRSCEARIVLGNHEDIFLGAGGERARQSPGIRQENLDFLAAQPYRIETNIAGKRLLITHASPVEPYNEYVYPRSPQLKAIAGVDADYVILGHTHFQMAERSGRVLVINPGSAGEARDYSNGRFLSCAVLDIPSGEVTFHDFPDPSLPATRG